MLVEPRTCPRCHSEVSDEANYCPQCSASLSIGEGARNNGAGPSDEAEFQGSIAKACDGPKGKVILFVIPLAALFTWWVLKEQDGKSGGPRMGSSNGPANVVSAVELDRLAQSQRASRSASSHSAVANKSPEFPQIVAADLGIWVGGQFVIKDTFKTGEWLTMRVRVNQPGFLRVLYWPAKGAPIRIFPESDGSDGHIPANTNVLVPDPRKLTQNAHDSEVFQLVNDPANDRATVERVAVQVSDEPFTDSGSVRNPDDLYRSYPGLSLMQARVQGVTRLQGKPIEDAMREMETYLNQRTLPLSIVP